MVMVIINVFYIPRKSIFVALGMFGERDKVRVRKNSHFLFSGV